MPRVQVVYWRQIPAQVKARQGNERASRPLSERFQQAIDEAAMRAGLSGTDAYLAAWRTMAGRPIPDLRSPISNLQGVSNGRRETRDRARSPVVIARRPFDFAQGRRSNL